MNIVDLRPKIDVEHPQEENEPNINPEINPQRRQFLKFLLVGGGAFVLGLFIRSLGFLKLFSKRKSEFDIAVEPETKLKTPDEGGDFTNLTTWKVVEKNGTTIFIDKETNEEVLILD